MAELPKTPELDKRSEIIKDGHSQAIGEFLDWLQQQGLSLMRYRTDLTDERPCSRCDGENRECPRCNGSRFIEITVSGWTSDGRSVEQLLADYFEIDLTKIEEERRALLDHIRTERQS